MQNTTYIPEVIVRDSGDSISLTSKSQPVLEGIIAKVFNTKHGGKIPEGVNIGGSGSDYSVNIPKNAAFFSQGSTLPLAIEALTHSIAANQAKFIQG